MSVQSLWAATAVAAPRFPKLDRDVQADVVIVGGGFTGLSAAHHIAKDGRRPVVLEAKTVGWGASGRNGGLVSGKFRVPFHEVAARHGRDAALRLYRTGHEAVDIVEELVQELGIDASRFTRSGYITAAHTERALEAQRVAVEWLRTELGDTESHILTREQVATELGAQGYVGGSLNTAAGCLHPLNYVRGLAAGVAARGIEVFEESPVVRVGQEGSGILVETPQAFVRAKQIVIATNAYSDLTGATAPFATSLVPFRSAIIATTPLSDNLRSTVLPSLRVAADTKRLLRWYRMVDGRLVFGGRGAFGKSDSEAAFRRLQKEMEAVFPQLTGQSIEFKWSGLVAMTPDQLPQIGRLDNGPFYAMGYNGTGVALSSLMGRYLAQLTRGEAPDLGLLGRPLRTIPFYPLSVPAVRIVTGYYQLLDALGR